MADLVYWSFVLALVPLTLDLIVRVSAGVRTWIASLITHYPVTETAIHFKLHNHLSGESWTPVKPADICHQH